MPAPTSRRLLRPGLLEGRSFAALLDDERAAHKVFGFHQYLCAAEPGSNSTELRPAGCVAIGEEGRSALPVPQSLALGSCFPGHTLAAPASQLPLWARLQCLNSQAARLCGRAA